MMATVKAQEKAADVVWMAGEKAGGRITFTGVVRWLVGLDWIGLDLSFYVGPDPMTLPPARRATC